MQLTYNIEDIPYQTAYAAYSGNSMSPERRANSERESYVAYIDEAVSELSKWDVDMNPERDSLPADIQRFIYGYKSRKLAYLNAMSRHYSAWISGPSNYPVDRMRKRMDTTDKRMNEMLDYCEKAIAAIHHKHNYKLVKLIESGDLDALVELQKKLEKHEKFHATMKAANRICRKKSLTDADKITQLVELDGITEQKAVKLLEPYMGQVGFPSFELTNNNATIKRVKTRIAQVTALQNATPIKIECEDYEITEDDADNRIRIVFPGKPDQRIIDWLKSHGWNWSRYNGAWQRKITANARRNARQFSEVYADTIGEL